MRTKGIGATLACALCVAGATALPSQAASELRCGSTPNVPQAVGPNIPAAKNIRAKGVTCKYARSFAKRLLRARMEANVTTFEGFRCTQKAVSDTSYKETCKKGDTKRITFTHGAIG